MTTTAAAASLRLEELPAVTVPVPSKRKQGLSRASFSMVRPSRAFIGVKDGDVAFAILELHRENFLLEFSGVDGLHGAAMALQGKLVLLLAGDMELLGHIFGGDAVVALGQAR